MRAAFTSPEMKVLLYKWSASQFTHCPRQSIHTLPSPKDGCFAVVQVAAMQRAALCVRVSTVCAGEHKPCGAQGAHAPSKTTPLSCCGG